MPIGGGSMFNRIRTSARNIRNRITGAARNIRNRITGRGSSKSGS